MVQLCGRGGRKVCYTLSVQLVQSEEMPQEDDLELQHSIIIIVLNVSLL